MAGALLQFMKTGNPNGGDLPHWPKYSSERGETMVLDVPPIMQTILPIPEGQVASYGQVAAAAAYPRHHRQVAQFLRKYGSHVPWQRVVGADGVLKTSDDGAMY